MIIGQTIVAVATGADGTSVTTTVYTPWIASWGNAAIFSFEVIALGGNATFTAQVQTKNSEDADSAAVNKGTLNSQTAPGTYSIGDASGLLELVRVEIKLIATHASGVRTAHAHFRPLNPAWKTN